MAELDPDLFSTGGPDQFGPVEQSYRDSQVDDELWREWASQHPDIAIEAIHEANAADKEGLSAQDGFLRGLKFATRLERNRREGDALDAMFTDSLSDIDRTSTQPEHPRRRLFRLRRNSTEREPRPRGLQRSIATAFMLSVLHRNEE